MKIKATAREIKDAPRLGAWGIYCSATGLDEWCLADGRMEDTEELDISLELAREIGLLSKDDES